MTAPMQFLSGGQDLRVFRKPGGGDSWGEKKAVHHHTLENVGVAPRTSDTKDGDGFRGRVVSGYTLYLDHEQVASLHQDDEIEMVFPNGIVAMYALDSFRAGANWANPLSFWQPGEEVNLKFLREVV
ncbi:head-to-tail stopper [Rhodococcus phage GuyFagieri]|nr:head-to-tail stopper [Rhodococcus phage GuyFagieri]